MRSLEGSFHGVTKSRTPLSTQTEKRGEESPRYLVMFFPLYTLLHLYIPLYVCVLSCSRMSNSFVTPRTAAHQAPLSMGFPRQEYWSALPFPPPGESSRHRDQTRVACTAGGFFTTEPPGKPWIEDMSVCRCVLSHFSCVRFFATL